MKFNLIDKGGAKNMSDSQRRRCRIALLLFTLFHCISSNQDSGTLVQLIHTDLNKFLTLTTETAATVRLFVIQASTSDLAVA